jgi:hypothetical protein
MGAVCYHFIEKKTIRNEKFLISKLKKIKKYFYFYKKNNFFYKIKLILFFQFAEKKFS